MAAKPSISEVEPPSLPLGYVRTENTAPTAPPRNRKSSGIVKTLVVLALLGGAGFGAWEFLPFDKIMAQFQPASAKGSTAAAAPQATTRTLTLYPGLVVTFDGAEAVRFTAARIYTNGREVPCMSGWLGVTGGNVNARLDSANGTDPFRDSCIRLRFVPAGTGPKALTVSSDEGNPNLHELEMADNVAELIYRGGKVKAAIAADRGRLRLSAAPVN